MMKYFVGTFGLFALIMLFGTWYTVDQGEQAVVLTNGSVTSVNGSGLYFKTPFFQSVEKFSTRTEKSEYTDVETYSKDIQTAKVTITVNHRLDPTKVASIYQTFGTNYEDKIITNTVLNSVKIVFGQYNATESIDHRANLVKDMTTALATKLEPYGILVENVSVSNIAFSEEYNKAVEARMKAEVEVQQANQTLQQEKIKADIARTHAQGEADAKLTAAQSEAKSIRLKGEALRDNPEVIKLTVAQGWDGVLPQVMLPNGATPMINMNSLLDK